MDWPKAKTIIIVLLVCVNLFLLGTYIVREEEARKDEIALRDNVCNILNNQGIKLEAKDLPSDSMEIRPGTVKSVSDTEDIAKRLFGEVSILSSDQNTVYTGQVGNIMFLRDSFSLVYELGEEVADEETALSFAESIAKKLNVTTSREKYSLVSGESGYTINIPQIFSGVRIFGSDIEIKISKSGSVIGSGKFIGHGRLGYTEGKTYPISSLMIRFAEGAPKDGETALAVKKIEYGYIAGTPVGGVVALTPVLDIETDKGSFYVNMTDGSFVEI